MISILPQFVYLKLLQLIYSLITRTSLTTMEVRPIYIALLLLRQAKSNSISKKIFVNKLGGEDDEYKSNTSNNLFSYITSIINSYFLVRPSKLVIFTFFIYFLFVNNENVIWLISKLSTFLNSR